MRHLCLPCFRATSLLTPTLLPFLASWLLQHGLLLLLLLLCFFTGLCLCLLLLHARTSPCAVGCRAWQALLWLGNWRCPVCVLLLVLLLLLR